MVFTPFAPQTLGSPPPGLQQLSGGGAITSSLIAQAVSLGYTGLYLDPRQIWTIPNTLVYNGIQNFRIVSHMHGSIGVNGLVFYNTSGAGYINIGATAGQAVAADGIQIYASNPTGAPTAGIIFENCVIVGNCPGFGVVHFGGGERDCGLVNSLVYNTSATAGSYGVISDTALSDNNGENNFFIRPRIAGAYAGLGIGIADQTQHVNDTLWSDLVTSGGTYGIVINNGGGHEFLNWYDRSSSATAACWNHGGKIMFYGGEDFNRLGGVAHLVDVAAAVTTLNNRTVTAGASANTYSVSAGRVEFQGSSRFNGGPVIAVTGGTIDVTGLTGNPTFTISGSGANVLLPVNPLTNLTTSGFTGTLTYPLPSVQAQNSGTGFTTTQTVTWTPPKSNCQFKVHVNIQVSVAGTSTVPQLSYTRRGGVAFGPTTLPMLKIDGATTAPTFTLAAAGTYVYEFYGQTDATGGVVTLTITPTGSTFNYAVVVELLNLT